MLNLKFSCFYRQKFVMYAHSYHACSGYLVAFPALTSRRCESHLICIFHLRACITHCQAFVEHCAPLQTHFDVDAPIAHHPFVGTARAIGPGKEASTSFAVVASNPHAEIHPDQDGETRLGECAGGLPFDVNCTHFR